MTFCKEIRQESQVYWEGSLRHPFVKGIVDGSLHLEKFKFYMLQDAYYLKHYAKILALAAVKAEDQQMSYFLEQTNYIHQAELQVHELVFDHLKVSKTELDNFIPAPTTHNYINHLYEAIYNGTLAEAFAAMLPCPWLYQEIGEKYKNAQPAQPLYQNWLAFYGSIDYQETVETQIRMMNEYTEAEPDKIEIFKEYFKKSCYYEWKFWEMSWTLESWEGEVLAYDFERNS